MSVLFRGESGEVKNSVVDRRDGSQSRVTRTDVNVMYTHPPCLRVRCFELTLF